MKKNYKTKGKIKKYNIGVQKVEVPEAGNFGTVANPALSLGQTGFQIGKNFGPVGAGIGAGVGALAGATYGLIQKQKMDKANKQALAVNSYADFQNNAYGQEDPDKNAMSIYKKGTYKVKKYPGGTGGIKMTPEERKKLQDLKNTNPQLYKKAIQEMIDYKPTSAPYGSELWKKSANEFDEAVKQINKGYHPSRDIKTTSANQMESDYLKTNILDPRLNNVNNNKLTNYVKSDDERVEEDIQKNLKNVDGTDGTSPLIGISAYKRGTKSLSKYPGGTDKIKLTSEELNQLNSVKEDKETYRQTLWGMIGYSPKSYPHGSEGWKQQEQMYNNAVNYVNQGFRPVTRPDGNVGYKKMYESGTKSIKPIEVEKDELIFEKDKSNKYKLIADFKGGKTHEQGGEPFAAKEGQIIFPGKMRSEVMKAYISGNTSKLEKMRNELPKDTPDGTAASGLDIASNVAALAPSIYNIGAGVFGKTAKTNRRIYNPETMTYEDTSGQMRQDVNSIANAEMDINRNLSGGNAGNYRANATSALNRKYKRMQDINNAEYNKKLNIDNNNTQIQNQAKMANLNLENQYDQFDLQNKARKNDFLTKGLTGISNNIQQGQLNKNRAERDALLMNTLSSNDYQISPDGSIINKSAAYGEKINKVKFDPLDINAKSDLTETLYKKGTKSIKKYKTKKK
jgi:hypothetical protein